MMAVKVVGLIIMAAFSVMYEWMALREEKAENKFWMAIMALGCAVLFGCSLFLTLPE